MRCITASAGQGTRPLAPSKGGSGPLVASNEDDATVRAEPFDAIELELGVLWADLVL
jgi:hypothetical protein